MTLPNFLQGFEIDNKQSLDCFNDLGLPTKNNENWHYLDMNKSLTGAVYKKCSNDNIDINQFESIKSDLKIDIINGNIGKIGTAPKGLEVKLEKSGFSDALIGENKHAIVSLNNAVANDVLVINAVGEVDGIIHLNYINNGEKTGSFNKVIVNVAKDSKFTFIETFHSDNKSSIFSNSLTEVTVADGAELNHYKLQNDLAQTKHIAYTKGTVGTEAEYSKTFICLNTDITRNEIEVDLIGTEGIADIKGIYVGRGDMIIDNTIRVNHLAENCESMQLFKGILNDTSQGVFQGKVYVDKQAQKTDGYQMHRSILLSDGAASNGKPELEIYADDVKCSHGSSTGEIDEEQLFYLTSRGIDFDTANKLLLKAFLEEVFDEIDDEDIKQYLFEQSEPVIDSVL